MSQWLDVMAHPPKVGQWAIVLCDERMEGSWYTLDFWPFKKRPRFSVQCAYVRRINQYGGIEWCRAETASGYPIGELNTVTHYQELPPVPEGFHEDEEITPLPKWATCNEEDRSEPVQVLKVGSLTAIGDIGSPGVLSVGNIDSGLPVSSSTFFVGKDRKMSTTKLIGEWKTWNAS